MKAFIEEYGATCVVVLVVLVLITLVTVLKEPLQGYYEQILENFFQQSNIDTSFIVKTKL